MPSKMRILFLPVGVLTNRNARDFLSVVSTNQNSTGTHISLLTIFFTAQDPNKNQLD